MMNILKVFDFIYLQALRLDGNQNIIPLISS